MLWGEAPGRTYEATTWTEAARIRGRRLLLPQLFRVFRGCTVLGIGELATTRFAELAPRSRAHLLPYPNDRADALLARPVADIGAGDRRPPRLLFVGELTRWKGVDLLAAACEQLWREGLAFSIRYAGRGAMEQLLREHAARSNGRAEVLGHIVGEDLLDVFAASDGLVLPSRWDGWGLVIHEALAAGLPVVVSDACGGKVLADGCGAIAKAGDEESLQESVRWFVSLSGEERRAITAVARTVAAELTMDRVGDALVAHAREALVSSSR
jgi:glycosyltransferase involved in cell wall biosynthesis